MVLKRDTFKDFDHGTPCVDALDERTPSIIDRVARSHSATASTSPLPSASIAFSSCGRPLTALPDVCSRQTSSHRSARRAPIWRSRSWVLIATLAYPIFAHLFRSDFRSIPARDLKASLALVKVKFSSRKEIWRPHHRAAPTNHPMGRAAAKCRRRTHLSRSTLIGASDDDLLDSLLAAEDTFAEFPRLFERGAAYRQLEVLQHLFNLIERDAGRLAPGCLHPALEAGMDFGVLGGGTEIVGHLLETH